MSEISFYQVLNKLNETEFANALHRIHPGSEIIHSGLGFSDMPLPKGPYFFVMHDGSGNILNIKYHSK